MKITINRKRYVLRNKRRFTSLVTVFVLVFVLMSMAVIAGAHESEKAYFEMIKVRQGDTLWEIANKHCTNKDVREYIYDIKKLNNLEDSYIYVGQSLYLP